LSGPSAAIRSLSAAPADEVDGMPASSPEPAAAGWELKLLYDGDCPLCSREVALLRRRNARARIEFEDIAAAGFDASRYGLDQQTVMARIHAVLPDGRVIEGMEVFRRAYAAVGLGWLLAPSRWPGVGRLFDAAYRSFARNRLRWTGRAAAACEAGHCEVAPRPAPRSS
jgi:predicted DCC family thiol-disulfide oxidoreductase YuxK